MSGDDQTREPASRQQAREFISRVYFFQDLPEEDLELIAGRCRSLTFPAGARVFREGDIADRFYIVLSGTVEVWKDYESESRDLLASHGPGGLFGEMALVDELPRSATIIARDPVELLYLPREDFRQVLRERSTISLSLLKSLSMMVRRSNDSFVEDLRRRNRQLESAYDRLRQAQTELLRSERLSALGKFSNMILHDIRNPISVLRSYGELIASSPGDPDRVRNWASTIVTEADRLNSLATELLDYSRGEIRLDMGIHSMGDLLERVTAYTGPRLAQSRVTLRIENSVATPVIVDGERMVRVLTNLVDNARKASAPGQEVRVVAVARDRSLELSVADDGEGMDPDVLKHVFEPFYSSSRGGGSGIGLVIVKNVVEAHHGHLELNSSPGKGTVVGISLPLRG